MRLLEFKIAAGAALVALLSGCAPTVSLLPADLANDPNCAEVMVRLPDEVAEQSRRSTNAQSTAAWGEPTSVIFRCGLEPVFVSELTCVTAGEVDWLVDDSEAPNYRFITFARTPATEIVVDSEAVAGVTVLEDLAGAIRAVPETANCTEVSN